MYMQKNVSRGESGGFLKEVKLIFTFDVNLKTF